MIFHLHHDLRVDLRVDLQIRYFRYSISCLHRVVLSSSRKKADLGGRRSRYTHVANGGSWLRLPSLDRDDDIPGK